MSRSRQNGEYIFVALERTSRSDREWRHLETDQTERVLGRRVDEETPRVVLTMHNVVNLDTRPCVARQHHQMHQQGPRPMDHQMHQQGPRPMDHQMHQQMPRPIDHQRFMLATPRVDIRYQPYPPRAGGGGGGRPVALGSQLDGWM